MVINLRNSFKLNRTKGKFLNKENFPSKNILKYIKTGCT